MNEVSQRKLIFLALLQGAMLYREGYWREEQEEFRKSLVDSIDVTLKDKPTLTGTKERKLASKVNNICLNNKEKLERFNKACYVEIKAAEKDFKKPDDDSFGQYVAGMGELLMHYITARNTADLISLCNAYNTGLLDEVLEVIKAERSAKVDKVSEQIEKIGL